MEGAIEWTMISWNLGLVSVRFHKCATLDEALRAFHALHIPVRLS
jgi:hypothetical protein